jgi:VWFA-related protein
MIETSSMSAAKTCLLWALAANCGLTVSVVQAQDQATFKTGTRLVEVQVVVRDKNGPVRDLTKDDFAVFDCKQANRDSRDPLALNTSCKGKRQVIQVFSRSIATAAAAGPSEMLPPGAVSNRHTSAVSGSATALLLDQLNAGFDNKGYERSQVAKLLQSLPPDEQVTVYSLGKRLHVLQGVTDPEKLIQAVTNLDDGYDLGVPGYVRDEITQDALEQIVRHLSGVRGRKNLIWVGGSGCSGTPASQERIMLLREANVSMYLVAIRTLVTGVSMNSRRGGTRFPMPDTLGRQKAIGDCAASTGGTGFGDASDVLPAVRRAEEDSASVYTLGFYPSESDLDGNPHELTVTVPRKISGSPGFEMHYRKEYLATPQVPVPPNGDLQAGLSEVLDSPIEASRIGLTAELKADHVDINVAFADIALQRQGDRWVGSFQIAMRNEVTASSGSIAVTNPVIRRVRLSLSDSEREAAARSSGYIVSLSLGAGSKDGRLGIAVVDSGTGAAGSLHLSLRQ